MTISIDKILTISAQDYVGPWTKVTDRYDLVGVHISGEQNITQEKFAANVPHNAEIVVNYQINLGGAGKYPTYYVLMSGTALIPRKNQLMVPETLKVDDMIGLL